MKNENNNIVFLVDKLIQGGGESILYDLISSHRLSKYSFKIICIGESRRHIVNRLTKKGADVVNIDKDYSRLDKYLLKPLYLVTSKLNTIDCDILHSYSLYTNLLSRIIKYKIKDISIVNHHHDVSSLLPKSAVLANQLTYWGADKIVSVSKSVHNSFYKYTTNADSLKNNGTFEVIYNGVNISNINKLSKKKRSNSLCKHTQSAKEIVTVGRLVHKKGHKFLIKAMPKITNKHPNAKLTIVGGGGLMTELRKIAKKLRVISNIKFTGTISRNDVFRILGRSDVFVFPSLYEGFGIATVEAMAVGLPVVATRIGPIMEIIQHGHSGLLVPPRDPKAIAAEICKLIDNEELRKDMGNNAEHRAKNKFSVPNMAERYDKMYKKII
jgi:glycosyltransferase involved in cell wall biosynthesis